MLSIVYISVFNNQHQAHLADAFASLPGVEYTYVETMPMHQWMKDQGWIEYSDRPYILKTYASHKNMKKAQELIMSADVVIKGHSPESLITPRLQAGKLTFRCCERWFKDRPWWTSGFRSWYHYFMDHIRYRNAPLYIIANSAYVVNDVYNIWAYPNKVFKFAYFTKTLDFDIEASLAERRNTEISLLWCGRFYWWKHPELAIQLARRLKDDGYKFRLDMIGAGEEKEKMQQLAKDLDVEDVVFFLGNFPNPEVHQIMRKHQIFLFTSDQNEGWGAVLNEAMSNGCAVVASNMIGAAPFLVKDGKNGLLFKSKDMDSLYKQTKRLLDDSTLRECLGREAYDTMRDEWSPEVGAKRFVQLCEGLLQNKEVAFEDGPCSKSYPIKW